MVETKFVGEKEMGVAGAEIVDVKDRVVDVAAPGPTCPVNTGVSFHLPSQTILTDCGPCEGPGKHCSVLIDSGKQSSGGLRDCLDMAASV